MLLLVKNMGNLIWSFFILGMVMASALFLGISQFMHLDMPSWWNYGVGFIFLIDLGFTWFSTAKPQRKSPRFILKTLGDLLACVPLGFFPLFKLFTVRSKMRTLQFGLSVNPSLMRLLSFGFWFVLALHFMSLGWVALGALSGWTQPFDQYLRAFYWVLTTVATVGFGDFLPDKNSNIQILYCIMIEIFGVGMYSYIIANVAGLLNNLDLSKAQFTKKLEEVRDFMHSRKIPKDLQKRVNDYFFYLQANHRSTESPTRILHDLPPSLSADLRLQLHKHLLTRVEFFQKANEIFLRQVLLHLQPQIYLPGDYIIHQGEVGNSMFFLSSGTVEVLVNNTRVATLGEGSPFGESSLVNAEPRNASVRTLEYCDVYSLAKDSFDSLRAHYPDFDAHILKIISERSKK